MNVKSIFMDATGRLRSGWRATFFVVSTVVAATLGLLVVFPVVAAFGVDMKQPTLPIYLAQFSIGATAAIFFGWLWGKLFEDLPLSALGVIPNAKGIRDLFIGIAVGAASLIVAVVIVMAFGSVSIAINSTSGASAIVSTLFSTLLLFTVGAAFEEGFFRGYFLQTFFRSELAVFGIVLTSVLFATMHNGNPGASPLSWLNTFLAGIWLAIAYWKTRNLWFPFGIHLAWNWTQGSVFGITVSGLESLTPDPLMRSTLGGPEWLSGGGYGVEASIACTIALIISSVGIVLVGQRKAEK